MNKYFEKKEDDIAFERCVDLIANLMIKYGPKVLEKRRIEALKKSPDCEFILFQNDETRKNRMLQYANLQYKF